MADNQKYIQSLKFKLAGSGVTASATILVLQSFKTPDGTTIALSDLGTSGFGTLEPGTSREEVIQITGVTQNGDGTADLTVTRGLNFRSPYTAASSREKAHAGGTIFVLSNPASFYDTFANKNNNETIAQVWTFGVLAETTAGDPVADNDLARKAYVDNVVAGSFPSERTVVAGTAGETVADGDLLFLDNADGEWKLADADTAATVENVQLGIAQGAGTDGNAVTNGILILGVDDAQSGFTAGQILFATDTAGTIGTSAGTKEVAVGHAKSATEIYFNPRVVQQLTEDEQDALAGATGTPSNDNRYEDENDTTNVATITGTTIAFVDSNPDTITDSGNGFVTSGFKRGQSVIVTGSSSNNATFTIVSVVAGTITLDAADSLTVEAAGATVTIAAATIDKLLRLDAAGILPAVSGANLTSLPNQPQVEVFTASGTWTRPATVTRVKVTVTGGGGGGRRYSDSSSGCRRWWWYCRRMG